MSLSRRHFIDVSVKSFAALALAQTKLYADKENIASKFKLKFAPRLTMDLFRASAGKSLLGRTQWFYHNGFTAVEGAVFFNHKAQSEAQKEEQAALCELVKKLGMQMGNISSMNEKDHPIMTANFAPNKKIRDKNAVQDFLAKQMDDTFEVIRRLGSKTFIIGAGIEAQDLSPEKQYENTVTNMRFCAEYCKNNGMTMQIEPLNTKTHKNIYITNAKLGARICDDVNLPSCRLLYDIYHEHIQMGNNDALDDDKVFKQILSFHIADAPGRNEPTSGNIDFPKILKKIRSKGFDGILGLEHGQTDKSPEGDQKLLEIYKKLDEQACS